MIAVDRALGLRGLVSNAYIGFASVQIAMNSIQVMPYCATKLIHIGEGRWAKHFLSKAASPSLGSRF